jgi:hypothetical protein
MQPAEQLSELTRAPIAERQQTGELFLSPLTRGMAGASAPLSFAQQQVWLHAQLAPDVPFYNEVLILQRTGALDRKV